MGKEKTNITLDSLTSVINLVDDAVFVKDDKHRFVLANDALCKMLGMKRADIIGKTLGESLPKSQMEHFLKIDKMVLDSDKANKIEEQLTGANGQILNIVTKKSRYIDSQGNKFLFGVIRDITERESVKIKLENKIDELEKINSLLIGRELKMIELKREINQLKDHTDEKSDTNVSPYLEGIVLEEEVIQSLKSDYEVMITNSGLSDLNKTKIINLLNTLTIESESHEKKLRGLDAKYQ